MVVGAGTVVDVATDESMAPTTEVAAMLTYCLGAYVLQGSPAVAVVVGGAAGHLGRGTTLGLAKEGVKLIVCDNDREGLETIKGEVAALGSPGCNPDGVTSGFG